MRQSTSRHQRGITLIEALIAFLVLALGMLAIARVQGQMRLSSEVARQRSEAVRLAQEDMESLRAFSTLTAAIGVRSFDAIASDTRTVDAAAGYATNTAYLVTREIDDAASLRAKHVRITVAWTDRNGGAQAIALSSVIAGVDPSFSGALGLARVNAAARGALGRSVRIPSAAKDLGDGRSAFKPIGNGTLAFVFDNLSGLLIGRCAGVATTTTTAALTIANLGACDANVGQLVSGVVRFSLASPPDAARASDAPAALSIAMAMSGGTYPIAPSCTAESITTATGERFMAWHCAVYPQASGKWSGRATVVPRGWVIKAQSDYYRADGTLL